RAYLRFFKNHPEQVELLILERAEFRDRKRSTYHDHREAGRPRWNRLVSDLVSSGRLREMPVSRVMDVVGDLLYGTMFTNHFSGGTKPLEEQAGDILDIIYHGMLSDRERDRIAPGGKRGKR
ncbi:MAG: TetR/AcrR family transcriptional regulator, partial [Gemmataceae bacterium]